MITKDDARTRVIELLARDFSESDSDIVVIHEFTREFEVGWVFFYDTAAFVRTGDDLERLIGNVPILIDRRTGEAHYTGTGDDIEVYIEAYLRHGTCHPE